MSKTKIQKLFEQFLAQNPELQKEHDADSVLDQARDAIQAARDDFPDMGDDGLAQLAGPFTGEFLRRILSGSKDMTLKNLSNIATVLGYDVRIEFKSKTARTKRTPDKVPVTKEGEKEGTKNKVKEYLEGRDASDRTPSLAQEEPPREKSTPTPQAEPKLTEEENYTPNLKQEVAKIYGNKLTTFQELKEVQEEDHRIPASAFFVPAKEKKTSKKTKKPMEETFVSHAEEENFRKAMKENEEVQMLLTSKPSNPEDIPPPA